MVWNTRVYHRSVPKVYHLGKPTGTLLIMEHSNGLRFGKENKTIKGIEFSQFIQFSSNTNQFLRSSLRRFNLESHFGKQVKGNLSISALLLISFTGEPALPFLSQPRQQSVQFICAYSASVRRGKAPLVSPKIISASASLL